MNNKNKKPKKTVTNEVLTKEERQQTLALLGSAPKKAWDEQKPKHDPYIKRDKRGRPTVITKQVLQNLAQAFNIGCSDREACIYAGIALQTLYNYCKENPDFLEQKEEWKENLVIAARANLATALTVKKSVPDSWEYIKRKRKAEFADMKVVAETEQKLSAKDLEDLEEGKYEVVEDEEDIEQPLTNETEQVPQH